MASLVNDKTVCHTDFDIVKIAVVSCRLSKTLHCILNHTYNHRRHGRPKRKDTVRAKRRARQESRSSWALHGQASRSVAQS